MFAAIIFIVLYVSLVGGLALVMDMKNNNTYNNHLKILDAIYDYSVDCIHNNRSIEVYYADMEEYNYTFWRLWDWGYEHILPEEKFEIIKPYIH